MTKTPDMRTMLNEAKSFINEVVAMAYDGEGKLTKIENIEDLESAIDRYKHIIANEKSKIKRIKNRTILTRQHFLVIKMD